MSIGPFPSCVYSFFFFLIQKQCIPLGFPGGSVVKNLPVNAGDMDWIGIGSGRSFGKGNGKPLQYSCLGNPWTEEPGRLQSIPSKRVGHSLATKQQQILSSYCSFCVLVLHSRLTLCNPLDCSPPGSSVHGFPRQKYWRGLPFPTSGDLCNPGIKPMSLVSPALAGKFFSISAIWEAQV